MLQKQKNKGFSWTSLLSRIKILEELYDSWERCRKARDNFDTEIILTGRFHGDTCCCDDCKAYCFYYYYVPRWKRCIAEILWGQP